MLRGRDAELTRFAEILDSAITARRGSAVSVVGEAGVGKTALLAAVRAAAVSRGFRVERFGLDEELRHDVLARLLSDNESGVNDPQIVLEGQSASEPLLITLDDLRWDGPAARVLGKLFSLVPTRPLVCVLAGRPNRAASHLDRFFRYLEDRETMVHMPLRQLSDEAVAAVAKDVLGFAPADALTELVACAEGNAAALVRLLDGLVREKAVHCEGKIARLKYEFTGLSAGAPLPECLSALVRRALDALSPQTRQTLEAAAVLGRSFTPDDVAEMLGQPVAVLLPAFREALNARVLDGAQEHMRFRRGMVWQTVLRGIPVPVRGALHRQTAKTLINRGGSAIDSAEHLLHGTVRHDEASVELLCQAAEQALPSLPRLAAELAMRGLELVSSDSKKWLSLAMIAVEACTRGGPLAQAVELAREAISRDVSPDAARVLRYWLATALTLQDRHPDAAEAAAGLLTDSSASADLTRRLLLNRSMAVTVRAAPNASQEEEQTSVCCPLTAWRSGALATALQRSREALVTPDARLPVTHPGHPRLAHAMILTGLGNLENARSAVADAEQDIDYTLGALPKLMRARLELAGGRLPSAAAEATESLTIARDTGMRVHLAAALAILITVALRQGRSEPGESGDELVKWATAEVAGTKAVTLEWARAQSALAYGDYHGCSQALEWFIRHDNCRALAMADCAAAAWMVRTGLAMGRRDWAVAAADAAVLLAKDNPDVRSLALAAAHARGLLGDDVEALSEAAEGQRDLWARASAAEDLGTRLGTVDEKSAVKRLEGALALYQSAGAERDVARTRRRLRALGVVKRHWRRPASPKSGMNSLTETERAITFLVAEGLTNKQVANRMFISHHTVAFHLRKVFRKLDIRSRIELIRLTQPDPA